MAAGSATGIASALSTALSALTPGQLLHLSHTITQTDEIRAMQILSMMQANPLAAASLLASLESISGLPAQVVTWVGAAVPNAVTNPALYQQNLAQAMAALQATPVSMLNIHPIFG